MRLRRASLLILFIFCLNLINAGIFSSEEVTFTLDQKEYYFLTGEEAKISIKVENTHERKIEGTLTSEYTYELNQGGMQYSSSKSQSIPFSVKEGESVSSVSFGSSKDPMTIKTSLSFHYTDDEEKVVRLEGIKVHFVEKEEEKKNEENKQSSTSKEVNEQKEGKSTPEESTQPSASKKLQNNQMTQDSSALKKQMQREAEKEEQLKKEFQEELAKNEEFLKEHEKLLNEGYNATKGSFDPESNKTGDFDMEYEKPTGESAQLKGSMQEGEIKEMQSLSAEDKKKMLEEMKESEEFQRFSEELKEKGFRQSEQDFEMKGEERIDVKTSYKKGNKSAEITSNFSNKTLEETHLEKPDEEESAMDWQRLFYLLLVVLFLGVFSYVMYKRTKKTDGLLGGDLMMTADFDYEKKAKEMLKESRKLFKGKRYKDAYEKVSQALRLYLSYKYDLRREVTNEEILSVLEKKGVDVKSVKECFDACDMVEFAKGKANKKDFEKIVKTCAKRISDDK